MSLSVGPCLLDLYRELSDLSALCERVGNVLRQRYCNESPCADRTGPSQIEADSCLGVVERAGHAALQRQSHERDGHGFKGRDHCHSRLTVHSVRPAGQLQLIQHYSHRLDARWVCEWACHSKYCLSSSECGEAYYSAIELGRVRNGRFLLPCGVHLRVHDECTKGIKEVAQSLIESCLGPDDSWIEDLLCQR